MFATLAAIAAAAHLTAARPPRCTPQGCFILASVPLTRAGGPPGGAPPPPPPSLGQLDFSKAANSGLQTLIH